MSYKTSLSFLDNLFTFFAGEERGEEGKEWRGWGQRVIWEVLFLKVYVACMCMGARLHMWAHIHRCTWACRLRGDSMCLPWPFSTYILRQGISGWTQTCCFLASQLALRIPYLLLTEMTGQLQPVSFHKSEIQDPLALLASALLLSRLLSPRVITSIGKSEKIIIISKTFFLPPPLLLPSVPPPSFCIPSFSNSFLPLSLPTSLYDRTIRIYSLCFQTSLVTVITILYNWNSISLTPGLCWGLCFYWLEILQIPYIAEIMYLGLSQGTYSLGSSTSDKTSSISILKLKEI